MGQNGSSRCVCTDAGQTQPWEVEKEGVTTLAQLGNEAELNKENAAPNVISKQVLPDLAVPACCKPIPGDVQQLKWAEVFYFTVDLLKVMGEDGFGLAHVPMKDEGGCLMVMDFRRNGAVARWNQAQERQGKWSHQIKRGDRIMKIGSPPNVDALRATLRRETVRLEMERWPETVCIRLTKTDPNERFGIGMELIQKQDGTQALRVSDIAEGIVMDWNRMAAGSKRYFEVVAPGSHIIRVDGMDGPADLLQALLKERHDVEVIFRRPAPEASP